MYKNVSLNRLKEKISYELWFLDFISKTKNAFDGGTDISTITLWNRKDKADIGINLKEVIGSGIAKKVLDALSPLTFIASYKIIDMIFEWILEENHDAERIRRVPWQFTEKIKIIKNSNLILPPIFKSKKYIKEYLFALYSKLLKFRHEVVHRHNFLVLNNKLRIDTIEKNKSYRLELDLENLGAFVRIAVAVANLLTGILSFGQQIDRLLKYHLDRIKELHGLAEFGQIKPFVVNVILNVPKEKGIFTADLNSVRKRISQIHPNVYVLFNLKVIGIVNNKPSIGWFFPIDFVPRDDIVELQKDIYDEYKISTLSED